MSQTRLVIVGAGIAGLCCALGLSQVGADVELVERVDEFREVGAAISLWPNALAALGRLGVEDAVRAVGWPASTLTVRSPSGRNLVNLNAEQVQRALGGEGLIIHRADLQRVLLAAVRDLPIRLSWACVGLRQLGATVVLRSDRGDELLADAVVGCDGARTVVGATFPDQRPLRYQGVTTWRAVLDDTDLVREAWLCIGEGKQFVASPLHGSRCYWSPMLRMKAGANAELNDPIAFLARSFSGWHAPIPQLIEKTEPASVIRTDVYDRMPSRLARGRIALAGDAGHPMNPALGQGACQAIVDAAVLGAAWQEHTEPPLAFAAYERARLRQARRIVGDSRRMNRVCASQSRVLNHMSEWLAAGFPDSLLGSMSARHGSRDAFNRSIRGVTPCL